MKIAIDIDETLVIHEKRDVEYTLKFAEKYNLEYKYNNGLDFKDGILIDWNSETLEKFWSSSFGKNFYKYADVSNKNKQIIQTLQKRGHEVVLITARNPKWAEITKNWVNKNLNNIEVIFAKNKAEICKSINVDIFVDNDLSTCKNVQNAGIQTFYFGKENSVTIPSMQDLNDLLKITKQKGENYER